MILLHTVQVIVYSDAYKFCCILKTYVNISIWIARFVFFEFCSVPWLCVIEIRILNLQLKKVFLHLVTLTKEIKVEGGVEAERSKNDERREFNK